MLKDLSVWLVGGLLAVSGCIIVTDDDNDGGDDDTGTDDDMGTDDGTDTDSDDGTDTDSDDGTGTSTDDDDDDTSTGDGDTGTGTDDGGTGGTCGWGQTGADPADAYVCDGNGPDPDGIHPLECPDDLVAGQPCGDVTGYGCCDGDGNLWYCTIDDELYRQECG